MQFDFDYWNELYQRDPDLFDQERRNAAEHLISKAPEHLQYRLRQLQWKIDTTISTSKTPLQAAIRLNQLLYEKFFHLNQVLCEASGHTPVLQTFPKKRDGKLLTLEDKRGTT